MICTLDIALVSLQSFLGPTPGSSADIFLSALPSTGRDVRPEAGGAGQFWINAGSVVGFRPLGPEGNRAAPLRRGSTGTARRSGGPQVA